MIVKCFQITDALQLTPVPTERMVDVARQPEARVWIDLLDGTRDEIGEWLTRLEVDDLERRLCLDAGDRPGFYPLARVIFFVIPVLSDAHKTGVEHVSLLCTETLLLTLHRKPVIQPEKLAGLDASESWLPERSVAGLVSALMIDQSLNALHLTASLRDEISALEDRMARDPESVDAEDILALRSTLVRLGAMVRDQRPSLQALSRTERSFFQLGEAREYMNCALTNCQTADESLNWMDRRLGDLRAAFQMHAQDKTNHRLNMLTILSAMFLPSSLLAAIWGMNFSAMPELHPPYAYPAALVVMVGLGAGIYVYFRRNGWMD